MDLQMWAGVLRDFLHLLLIELREDVNSSQNLLLSNFNGDTFTNLVYFSHLLQFSEISMNQSQTFLIGKSISEISEITDNFGVKRFIN